MFVEPTEISGLHFGKIHGFEDERGRFAKIDKTLLGLEAIDSYLAVSYNIHKHTLRGMHLQVSPFEERKFIYVVSGSIYDVIIDLRPNSQTYLKWTSVNLGPLENSDFVEIPSNCAHGYLTLEGNSTILYRINGVYSPNNSKNIRWDDPNFDIDWPAMPKKISKQDTEIRHFKKSSLDGWT